MSNQRRRAHYFIDFLTSFRQTINEKSNSAVFQVSSENKLNYIKNKPGEDDKHSYSKNNE